MFNVGDIVEINGHKCVITYANGDNYSYHEAANPTPVTPKAENAEIENSTLAPKASEDTKRRGRRKRNG